MAESSIVQEELYRIGAMQLLEDGQPRKAALLTYEWLMKGALSAEGVLGNATPNLYGVLSYLIDRGKAFGFTFDSNIEQDRVVFTVTNNQLQGNLSVLLELLLTQIFEQLCNIESEVKLAGKDTIIKIRLPKSI